MAENKHKHGEMDISVQEKTFEGFVTWSMRVAIASIAILVFLAIFNT
ncbi:aa3-type cytochrome c oxidase subunit IV [Anianabacter salinae]|nr:aa3-type cytochrome c oxidase subunit IV [Anianabacter salinae]MBV0913256.1 aa3-type cytochrome c oxidase subunit IV [Anianabacter salinae]